MTKTEFDSMKMVVPGNKPFAGGDQATVIPADPQTGNFNIPDGWNSEYDAAPNADGSNMILRGQMNFLGKMASYAPFIGQTGGGFWGFDPQVCSAIGGYPRDAILTYVDNGSYLKVKSLVDDNMVDFTSSTDVNQFPNIINGSVDGINWQYLNLDPQNVDMDVVLEVPNIYAPAKDEYTTFDFQPLVTFKATHTGLTSFTGSIDIEDATVSEPGMVNFPGYGLMLILIGGTSDIDMMNGINPGSVVQSPMIKKNIFERGNCSEIAGLSTVPEIVKIERGCYYSIWAAVLNCKVSNSSLKLKVSAG